jgi:hypothetical protein
MINVDQLHHTKISWYSYMFFLVFCLDSSPVAKNGLLVKQEQSTATHWWALQQLPNFEFGTMILLNIDQIHHLKISWYSYIWFFSHFDSISHHWQMMASGSNSDKQQQNSGWHCSNHEIVNSGYGLCSI